MQRRRVLANLPAGWSCGLATFVLCFARPLLVLCLVRPFLFLCFFSLVGLGVDTIWTPALKRPQRISSASVQSTREAVPPVWYVKETASAEVDGNNWYGDPQSRLLS